MRRTLTAGALVTGLVMGALYGVPADAAGEHPSAADAAVGPSVVAQGKVRTAAGKAAAAGTPVVLYAWPSNDVTDKMVVGDEVKLQPLSQTTTAADGSFALQIDDLAALAPVTGTDKIVNFEITAGQGETATQYSFPRKVTTTAGGSTALVDAVSDAAPGSRPEPPPLLTVDLAAGTISDANTGPTDTADPAAVVVPDQTGFAKACIARQTSDLGQYWAVIGQHYNETNHVVADFLYIRGASSALGVAYSASGRGGTFKAQGTMAKSTTASIDYPGVGDWADRYRKTIFRYGMFYVSCSQGGGVPPLTYYEARPAAWMGGSQSVQPATVPRYNAAYCAPYERGTIFVKETTRAITWTNGVEIKKWLGFDLSAQTGYSATARAQFGFNQTRRLCGSNGPATGNAAQLISHGLGYKE